MKPKLLNKNLSLPWTPQGEIKRVETIKFSKRESFELNFPISISLSGFVFPDVLHQFVDLADRVVVTDSWSQSQYLYQLAPSCEQKPIGKKGTYLRIEWVSECDRTTSTSPENHGMTMSSMSKKVINYEMLCCTNRHKLYYSIENASP